MKRHFRCTQCGACCYGVLPLTIADAWKHAELFPLAFLWQIVPKNTEQRTHASSFGVNVRVDGIGEMPLICMIVSYVPSTISCPALHDSSLCGIHPEKPMRCQTMPFYPFVPESAQASLINPRKQWQCDISPEAPLVYEQKRIIDKAAFDAELHALEEQAPLLQKYAQYLQTYTPHFFANLFTATQKKQSLSVSSLSSFFTATKECRAQEIASKQLAVLSKYAAMTKAQSSLHEFHQHYSAWFKEMQFIAERKPTPVQ